MAQAQANSVNNPSPYNRNYPTNQRSEEVKPLEYRIGLLAAGIAVTLTALIDVGQFIFNLLGGTGVIINRLITVASCASFALWFTFRKVSVLDPEIIKGIIAGGLTEALPVIDSLPALTVIVIRIIKKSREDDRERYQLEMWARAKKKKVIPPSRQESQTQTKQFNTTGQPMKIGQPATASAAVNLASETPSPTAESANIIDMESLRSPEPVNLATEPDQYREAA